MGYGGGDWGHSLCTSVGQSSRVVARAKFLFFFCGRVGGRSERNCTEWSNGRVWRTTQASWVGIGFSSLLLISRIVRSFDVLKRSADDGFQLSMLQCFRVRSRRVEFNIRFFFFNQQKCNSQHIFKQYPSLANNVKEVK